MVVKVVELHYPHIKKKPDAVRKMGILSIQNSITVVKQLAYRFSVDACDEYV
jgi:hypothetical protein